MSNFFRKYYLSIILIAFFALTRFYNLEHRIIFGWDQEQFSTQLRNIILYQDFTLLGPRVNNDLGFFLAPYFTYILVPFYFFSKLHPNALVLFVILIDMTFILSSYFLLKKIFTPTHAHWFLFLWIINPQAQNYDVIPWWPLMIPLGTMIVLGLLYYIYHRPHFLLWIMLGVVEGFFINMHFQFVFVVFLTFVFILLKYSPKSIPWVNIAMYFGAFSIMFVPLLIFDIRNEFLNTQLFIKFFFSSTTAHNEYFSWIPVLKNFFQPFTLSNNSILAVLFYGIFIWITLILKKVHKGFKSVLYGSILITAIAVLIFFTVYAQRPSEYYFMFLLPLILIVFVDYLMRIKRKLAPILVATLLLVFNGGPLLHNVKNNYGGLYYKNNIVLQVKEIVEDKPFNISYAGISVDHGFAYLLDYHDLIPQIGAPLIQIEIVSNKENPIEGLYGIIIPPELEK
ncbi:MAG: hypothetical protein O3B87_01155 [bacterium]|nr:hypothetical protein [bacterium]